MNGSLKTADPWSHFCHLESWTKGRLIQSAWTSMDAAILQAFLPGQGPQWYPLGGGKESSAGAPYLAPQG